jgi:hypothetical protein
MVSTGFTNTLPNENFSFTEFMNTKYYIAREKGT